MSLQEVLSIFGVIAGVVAVFELLEYIFTKNIPWLVRLVTNAGRWLRRRFGRGRVTEDQHYLVINFSAHPIMPEQQQAIQNSLGWLSIRVIDVGLGNVTEGKDFVPEVIGYAEKIDLLPSEWQTYHLAIVPAGYSPAWAVLLAELHGRLGYFPDMVRLRPAPAEAEEKYEVAEIVSLREVRNQARAKRQPGAISQPLPQEQDEAA